MTTTSPTAADRWMHAEASARLGIWDLDVPRSRVRYSPQWKALLGYEAVDAEDGTEVWRRRVHPDDLPGMQASLVDHLDGRSPHYVSRFRLRTASGEYRPVLSRGRAVVRDGDGRALRAIGSLIDLGDLGEAADAALRVAEHEEAVRARFLSRMSHELRTPMHAILGFAQLLDARLHAGGGDVEEQRRYLQRIERAGWEMVSLIDGLLEQAASDGGTPR